MKRLKEKKKVNLLLEFLLLKSKESEKNKKDVEEVKVEIPMVLEEDPNPGKTLSVTTATS